ncbi:MAG: hypothetical protein PHF18_05135 [Methanosarcina sp.]|uniref:hypothetical protein n=1 Tax=Methanosarcina sp. TaxID=2213 RepID=UPI0026256093|nr:hypothetical protein [Methanosarcina sp.]MDD3246225.1 hypothetical protein [Methanosarcina sp.]
MPTAFRNRGTLRSQTPGPEINKKGSIKRAQDLEQKALNIKETKEKETKEKETKENETGRNMLN